MQLRETERQKDRSNLIGSEAIIGNHNLILTEKLWAIILIHASELSHPRREEAVYLGMIFIGSFVYDCF